MYNVKIRFNIKINNELLGVNCARLALILQLDFSPPGVPGGLICKFRPKLVDLPFWNSLY